MKLHIGCGQKFLPGYKHIDIMDYPHIDFLTAADDLHMINNDSVEEIYACHILEHFGRLEYYNVLKEWHRTLKTNGILRLAVPNFDAIVEHYNKNQNLSVLLGLLYGGQNYEYNYHYMTYNFDLLSDVLKNIGFDDIKIYRWQDFLPEGFDDYSRSYIPHMDFDNGILMSLNMVAKKV